MHCSSCGYVSLRIFCCCYRRLGRSALFPEWPQGNLSLACIAGACREGDVEFVRLLLSGGAQVDARGPDGATPLLAAADGGFVK